MAILEEDIMTVRQQLLSLETYLNTGDEEFLDYRNMLDSNTSATVDNAIYELENAGVLLYSIDPELEAVQEEITPDNFNSESEKITRNLLRVLKQKKAQYHIQNISDPLLNLPKDEEEEEEEIEIEEEEEIEIERHHFIDSNNSNNSNSSENKSILSFLKNPAVSSSREENPEITKVESIKAALEAWSQWKEDLYDEEDLNSKEKEISFIKNLQAELPVKKTISNIFHQDFLPRLEEFYLFNYPRITQDALSVLFLRFEMEMKKMIEIVATQFSEIEKNAQLKEKVKANVLKACKQYFQTNYLAISRLKTGPDGRLNINNFSLLNNEALIKNIKNRVEQVAKLELKLNGGGSETFFDGAGFRTQYLDKGLKKDERANAYIAALVEMKKALEIRFPKIQLPRYKEALTFMEKLIDAEIKKAQGRIFRLTFNNPDKELFDKDTFKNPEQQKNAFTSLYHFTALKIENKIAEIDGKPKTPAFPNAVIVPSSVNRDPVTKVIESLHEKLKGVNKNVSLSENIHVVPNAESEPLLNEKSEAANSNPQVSQDIERANQNILEDLYNATTESALLSAYRVRAARARGQAKEIIPVAFSKDKVVTYDKFEEELNLEQERAKQDLAHKAQDLTNKIAASDAPKELSLNEILQANRAVQEAKAALYKAQFSYLFTALERRLTNKFAMDLLSPQKTENQRREIDYALQNGNRDTINKTLGLTILGLNAINVNLFQTRLNEWQELREGATVTFAETEPKLEELNSNNYVLVKTKNEDENNEDQSSSVWQLYYVNRDSEEQKRLVLIQEKYISDLPAELNDANKKKVRQFIKSNNQRLRDQKLKEDSYYRGNILEKNIQNLLQPGTFHEYYTKLAHHLDETIALKTCPLKPADLPKQEKPGFLTKQLMKLSSVFASGQKPVEMNADIIISDAEDENQEETQNGRRPSLSNSYKSDSD